MMIFIKFDDDKIHARSTVALQLSSVNYIKQVGKAIHIAYRSGEMDIAALEAYGASYTPQEILTVTYHDVESAVETMRAFYKATLANAGAFCF